MHSKAKITVKFGGSSLANAEQFKKSADIILTDKNRRYIIPSAPGKRFPNDEKVTDLLFELHASVGNELKFSSVLNRIKDRYDSIAKDLSLDISLDGHFDVITENIKNGAGVDYAASRGEYLNGILLAKFLKFEFVDAADIIFFDENGIYNPSKTNLIAGEILSKIEYCVIPGFYGSKPDGSIKTFSRSGSDISGAIVARAVMADLYENWTDVSGFLTTDPRIVNNPLPIDLITYRELRELSYMGASVFHEDAIFPVKMAGIPINIKNTNNPSDKGTMIVPSETSTAGGVVTGIAGKKGFSVIRIEKDMMNQELGFGMKVLSVLNDLKMSFEHLPSGIDTLSVVVDGKEIVGREREILSQISKTVNPDNIEIEQHLALIAVVGRGMIKTKGTASRVFASLSREGINIRMIDQGSSELNIIIGVEDSDFEKSINTIYNEFFK